jgi:hypothetical protein
LTTENKIKWGKAIGTKKEGGRGRPGAPVLYKVAGDHVVEVLAVERFELDPTLAARGRTHGGGWLRAGDDFFCFAL